MKVYWEQVQTSQLLQADFYEYVMELRTKDNNAVSTKITPEIYYEHMYAEPKEKTKYNELYKQVTDRQNSQVFFVEGFAGCGKSTIVNRIFYDITRFEKRKYDYKDFNYKIDYCRYNYNQGANTCPNSNDEVDSLIREKLVLRSAPLIVKNSDVWHCFQYLVDNQAIVKIDKNRTIQKRVISAAVMEQTIKRINAVQDKKKRVKYVEAALREQLRGISTSLLLAIDYLWRLAQYLVEKEESYLFVAYDNMDAIDRPEVLENFDEELVSFIINLNAFMENIYEDLKEEYGLTEEAHFAILTTYRKITTARVKLDRTCVKHEVMTEDKNSNPYIVRIDVSDYYDYCEIVNKKIDFFQEEIKNNKISSPIVGKLEFIKKLNNTKIIRSQYKAFWNHNFRGCAKIMQNIVDSKIGYVSKIVDLANENFDEENDKEELNVSFYSGASSIFLRVLCDLFREGAIFGSTCLNLIKLNEDEKEGYTTLSRLILNYYYSHEKASINGLFRELRDIYSPSEIAAELAALLDKNEMWRRPLYYTANALPNAGLYEALQKQASYFKENDETFMNYSELQICPCGEVYIRMIVTSYEFFACRCLPGSKPMYYEEVYANVKQMVEEVYNSVENCCKNLKAFREKVEEVQGLTTNEFMNLSFHAMTRGRRKQLHEERIIFHHIGYLELFRQYKIKGVMTEKKIAINKLITDIIIKYIQLYYKYIDGVDSQRREIARILMNKADVIVKSGYVDNKTQIQS